MRDKMTQSPTGKFGMKAKPFPRVPKRHPFSPEVRPQSAATEPNRDKNLVPFEALRWAAEHIQLPPCSDLVDELPFDTSAATRPETHENL